MNSPLFTKRTGAAVTLDILALNGAVLNTSSNDSVAVQLVVATNTAACGTVAVSNAVTIAFVPANGGRLSVTLTPSRAARDVRVRLVSSGITACSKDNFAVRPDSLSVSSSSATADSAGASVSATPVFKAGSAGFGLQATGAVGYDGTPVIAQLRRQAASGTAGAIGGLFGAGDPVTGVAAGAAFTYAEVGYFRLNSWGVYDDSFTSVDSGKSPAECFTDSALGSATAPGDPNTVNASGKLGCYFGSAQTNYFGRFIPDHFALSAGAIVNRSATAACAASTFTYLGETFTPTFVLTAQNAANATTVNYTGTLARLTVASQLGIGVIDDPAAGPRTPLAVCTATPVAPCVSLGAPAGAFTAGVSNTISAPLTVLRAGTAAAPYTALKVGVTPIDADGVRMGAYNLDTVNVVAGANQRTLVAGTILRYGRLLIDNAYGSELLNLNVKVTAQYWRGTSYATNTLDSCTPLGASAFTLTGQGGGLSAANMNAANLVAGAMSGGVGKVVLTKPTPAPTTKGRALLQSVPAYLPGSGRVTFGVYKAGPVIYLRETY
jgi:MSHA biogenesis protein MshQ